MEAASPSPVQTTTALPAPGTHVPERSCAACRRKRPQGELVRLSRVDGGWAVQEGHRTGRGGYLCADTPACWAEKRLKRMFGAQAASISADLLNRSGRLPPHPEPSIQTTMD